MRCVFLENELRVATVVAINMLLKAPRNLGHLLKSVSKGRLRPSIY